MDIYYLTNSGVAIKDNDNILLFDYYLDPQNIIQRLTSKNLYIFVSHKHYDHFNKKIFEFKGFENVYYFLDKDVFAPFNRNVYYFEKMKTLKFNDLFIEAFGSTDEGISFYVEYKGFKIFHSGDLNNWHWNEEADKYYVNLYEKAFKEELKIVSDRIKALDLLMFPVDPRLGKDFLKGPITFMESINVKNFFPIHFKDEFLKLKLFEPIAKQLKINYLIPKKVGDKISL